jgi:hypothetical protein
MKFIIAARNSIDRARHELNHKMKDDPESNRSSDAEDKITALLQLRAKLEQELQADTRRIEDLKKECELKLNWIHHLDELLSEASFQPASALLHDFPLVNDIEEPAARVPPRPALANKADPLVIDLKSFSEPVNFKNPKDGTIFATINFLQGNTMIMLSEKLKIVPESRLFTEIFQKGIVAIFEKEGGKVYLERDDTGVLRMITISGTFKTDLKERLIKQLAQVVTTFRDASKGSS